MTLFLSHFQAESQFSEFFWEANWFMLVSSPSILMRSCQRAAKIVQLLHLLPNTEIKGHSVSIINKTRELSQSKQPSLKFILHPEVHQSVSHCCKSTWLIRSSLHLTETDAFPPMGWFDPRQHWWTAQQGGESCWRNLPTGSSAGLALSQAWRCLVLILPSFHLHTWSVAGAVQAAKMEGEERAKWRTPQPVFLLTLQS